MVIVPAGKLRLMVAQRVDDPLYDNSTPEAMSTGTESIPEIGLDVDTSPQVDDLQRKKNNKVNKKKTLSDYIFHKLEEFGYPGRRLEEFKKKFVNESVSPDGTKTVVVEIPDKKYPDLTTGEVETIEADDLSGIVGEIEKFFGLHFNGAKRSDGKWIINLSSVRTENIDEENQQMIRDNLDEVYGTPTKKNRKVNPESIRGFTIQEMVKIAKIDLLNKLTNDIIGDEDAF